MEIIVKKKSVILIFYTKEIAFWTLKYAWENMLSSVF